MQRRFQRVGSRGRDAVFVDGGFGHGPFAKRPGWPRYLLFSLVALLAVFPIGGAASGVPTYAFATPIFGLATAPDGSLLVADAGAGIVELRNGEGSLVASLAGVTDVAPIGRGAMFAITAGGPGPDARKLFRVSRGSVQELADLGQFEADVNPDRGAIDSNPFDVAAAGDEALVADAGGNDLLVVNQKGDVDWVATLPIELASTENLKALAGCPNPPPPFAYACSLPAMIPAQAVATSIAIGPDGAYYVGELKGFPAPTGMSRVWRIAPGTRHADCATSSACAVVATGFTSIVDLAFAPDGSLYVVEIDEASWAAVELGLPSLGGTADRCQLATGKCTEVATHLVIPIAVAISRGGMAYVAINALIPGGASIITLP